VLRWCDLVDVYDNSRPKDCPPKSSAMTQYFVQRGDKVHGPFSEAQLKAGLKAKKLSKSDLFSTDRRGPWRPINFSKQTKPTDVAGDQQPETDILDWLGVDSNTGKNTSLNSSAQQAESLIKTGIITESKTKEIAGSQESGTDILDWLGVESEAENTMLQGSSAPTAVKSIDEQKESTQSEKQAQREQALTDLKKEAKVANVALAKSCFRFLVLSSVFFGYFLIFWYDPYANTATTAIAIFLFLIACADLKKRGTGVLFAETKSNVASVFGCMIIMSPVWLFFAFFVFCMADHFSYVGTEDFTERWGWPTYRAMLAIAVPLSYVGSRAMVRFDEHAYANEDKVNESLKSFYGFLGFLFIMLMIFMIMFGDKKPKVTPTKGIYVTPKGPRPFIGVQIER
jgi:hypothetical protein